MLQRTSRVAKRTGNQVDVVAPVPYAPQFLRGTSRGALAKLPAVENIAGLRVHHPRYPLLPGVSMPLHAILMFAGCHGMVRRLHRVHSFDCIDANYVFPDGLAAVLIGRSLGIPVTLTARGSDIHTFPQFATIRPQIRWALRHAQGVAAVSSTLAEIMLKLEPSLADVKIIGNGVDGRRFFSEDRRQSRSKLGLDERDKIIVSVAALKPVKGPDLLVRAASLLRRSIPGCRVLFVGNGPELPALKQLALKLECEDVCEFIGPVDNEDLRHYYSAADVSCLASRNEGWPNVVLESLACGTPVVATRVGAVPDILSQPGLGILTEPNPESIHQGLRQALDRSWDTELIQRIAHRHTWDEVGANVEAFLRSSIHPSFDNVGCAIAE